VDAPLYPSEPGPGRRKLVFLSRVHPKKGVDLLVRAWSAVSTRFPDWELDIIGPDEIGSMEAIRRLVAELHAERVTFVGPLYGEEKWRALGSASAFVLPTHSENFGIAVAEALAVGVPAIVTRGAPWSGLEQERCGWWIDRTLDALVGCLEVALAMPQDE